MSVERIPLTVIRLRPSQWLTFLGANVISKIQTLVPWIRQWSWYCFQRALLIYTAKYAIDVFWLQFKKRKLGVTFFRELTLMHWVPPSKYFDKAGRGREKKDSWFYGDMDLQIEMKDDTTEILDKMQTKAMKMAMLSKRSEAEEMQAVARVLRNFKHFSPEQIMSFFKASELVGMEEGQVIFSWDDDEKYFYGVVSGEIHLFCDGIGTRGVELIKVAGPDECIVSLLSFLRHFAIGPQKYADLKLHATCAVSGSYYRVPIDKILDYMWSDPKIMFEMLGSVIIRHQGFCFGLNDLTGLLPRLHKQSYLDARHTPIDAEPGILKGTTLEREAFEGLEKFFPLRPEDRKLCWVGILDSRTVLLGRFKKTHYAFYIHKGLLACTVSKLRRSYNAIQFYLMEGQVVGWREALMGVQMSVQYQVADAAKALIVAIPDFLIRRYIEDRPDLAIPLIKKVLDRNSLLVEQISYTLRFSHARASEAVFGHEPGSELESSQQETFAYLCLSGRLRFLLEPDVSVRRGPSAVNPKRFGIIEKGEWFGMMSMYSDSPRVHRNVICDRYCEYVMMPRYMVCVITNSFREAAGYQCDYLARAIDRDHEHTFLDTDKMADTQFQVDNFGVHTSRTYRVVCVYPVSPDIPGKIYCDELARHHTSPALVVTRKDALEAMKVAEFTIDNDYLLAKWLVAKEEETTVLFLLAVNDFNDHWNVTIAKICDMVQVLVTYSVSHKMSEGEKHILSLARKARKELVFIHPVVRITKPQIGPASYPHLPQGSIVWLRPRKSWVQRHHHVRMLDSSLKYAKESDPADLERYLKDTKDPDKHCDFARVMRWISGQSVGIVLGGGGAKGAAHLGTLHYLREMDVPVDYIAGVSIGSFLGALYAVYENIIVVESKAKELWENLKNPVRFARDITYNPFSSLFRGNSFDWMINYFFGSIQIEDLYIPYFCVTTDLKDCYSRTHMTGDLWFYVRASMTLVMLFPPQINQLDNHFLMDGGYSDLVPAMAMRRLGIKYLVAINIGDERLIKTFNIGYHVSGFKCLLQSLMPHSIDAIPNYFDIWDAILYCSARNFIQILKAMDEYCIYIRPNINAYTALDFKYYDEIKRLGYLSTKFKFGGLKLKNLPVHVIWYLLRFYTYPYIAQSQSQMLQGFTNEDWEFAVELMQKTQMFMRAKTPFLKMNLTPYLTDLMDARSYLETHINSDDEMASLNLNVPVLENFFRDDERLDLVHALAKMKEWNYMEDFESIAKRKVYGKNDFKIRTNLHAVASQSYDLANARSEYAAGTNDEGGELADFRKRLNKNHKTSLEPEGLDLVFGAVKETYSIKDLYLADPSLFQAVMSYRKLQSKSAGEDDIRRGGALPYGVENSVSRVRIGQRGQAGGKGKRGMGGNGGTDKFSYLSLRNIVNRLSTTFTSISGGVGAGISEGSGEGGAMMESRPTAMGQRLEDYRKYKTRGDRKLEGRRKEDIMVPIMTLKELRRSFLSRDETAGEGMD